jgi:hypothetical protein
MATRRIDPNPHLAPLDPSGSRCASAAPRSDARPRPAARLSADIGFTPDAWSFHPTGIQCPSDDPTPARDIADPRVLDP